MSLSLASRCTLRTSRQAPIGLNDSPCGVGANASRVPLSVMAPKRASPTAYDAVGEGALVTRAGCARCTPRSAIGGCCADACAGGCAGTGAGAGIGSKAAAWAACAAVACAAAICAAANWAAAAWATCAAVAGATDGGVGGREGACWDHRVSRWSRRRLIDSRSVWTSGAKPRACWLGVPGDAWLGHAICGIANAGAPGHARR